MSAAPRPKPAGLEKTSILVVDDNPESLFALSALLEGLGQNVVCARSGREALREVLARDFAVILLDVRMPDMDGLETATLLRQRERTRHTPIIFLTAANRTEAGVFEGYATGAVDYLFKPVNAEILRSKVSVFVELAKKTAALEALNRELEAFSYSVSHDLRGPLRGIDGFAQLLSRRYADRLDEAGRDFLRRLQGSAARMARLIDDLLKLSRLGRSPLERRRTDLSALARDVVASLRRGEPARQVDVRVQEGLTAEADAGLLLVVLENLLGNAWKFTSRRARARIELGTEERGGETVYFVKDDGAGFDMAAAGRLFAPFQRLHAAGEFSGTGIGLATVRRVVERHGGRLWAEAAPDRGAAFYFTLRSP